jgi:hypothetical protein
LIDEIDARQDQVLADLQQLNERVEQLLSTWVTAEATKGRFTAEDAEI